MAKKPFFSIAIPTYNRASDLQFAIYCILNQSFSDFEIIVSDNCSTDNTKEILGKLKDKRIRYFRNKKNINFAQNVKEVIKHAKGEYVFLHGDDDFILYQNALEKIYEKMQNYKPGYARVNFMSLALDKKHVFLYRLNKQFARSEYLLPFLSNEKVLAFITDSNPYFITGIVFKNALPKHIKIINSDPYPWINVLFYLVKNFGSCFIAEPQIVATWSRRKIKKNADHHLFTLTDGKLKSENYFNAVREKIDKLEFERFIHSEFMHFYVRFFPVVKINVGNKKMLQLCARIRVLDATMAKSLTYWMYFIPSLIIPANLLSILRDTYLYLYTRFSRVNDNVHIMNRLKKLEEDFIRTEENLNKSKKRIFKF